MRRSLSLCGKNCYALRGGTFLSLNKKVTKEVSLGESAQASWRQFAPSPKNPSLISFIYKDIMRFKLNAGSNKGSKNFAHNNGLTNNFVHQSRIIAVISEIQAINTV